MGRGVDRSMERDIEGEAVLAFKRRDGDGAMGIVGDGCGGGWISETLSAEAVRLGMVAMKSEGVVVID